MSSAHPLGRYLAVIGLLTLAACAHRPSSHPSPFASLCYGLATSGPLPLDTIPSQDGLWLLSIPTGWAGHRFDSIAQTELWAPTPDSSSTDRIGLYLGAPPALPPDWPGPGDVECALPAFGQGVMFRHYVLPSHSPVHVTRLDWPGQGVVTAASADDRQALLLAVAAILSAPRPP